MRNNDLIVKIGEERENVARIWSRKMQEVERQHMILTDRLSELVSEMVQNIAEILEAINERGKS